MDWVLVRIGADEQVDGSACDSPVVPVVMALSQVGPLEIVVADASGGALCDGRCSSSMVADW